MAYNNSGLLSMGSTYQLGQYSIRCFDTTEAGVRYVLAHISGPEGNSQTGIIVVQTKIIEGWYCEANESEVTIYVKIKERGTEPPPPAISLNYFEDWWVFFDEIRTEHRLSSTVLFAATPQISGKGNAGIVASPYPFIDHFKHITHVSGEGDQTSWQYTENGLTVHYIFYGWTSDVYAKPNSGATLEQLENRFDHVAWLMVYGGAEGKEYDGIVARFPISIREAGGGPAGSDPSWGSDVGIWDEPGDVDYEREPEEPTRTLYLIVQGATSGRHNDPIVDPTYSYVPAPKNTEKSDGNGGDGGDGGGGGAGASTLVTRPFGTGQADNKEITLHARRHGYGSTGGKGGKAGDGCILIYYRTEDEET